MQLEMPFDKEFRDAQFILNAQNELDMPKRQGQAIQPAAHSEKIFSDESWSETRLRRITRRKR